MKSLHTNVATDTYIGETRQIPNLAGSYYLIRRESDSVWYVLREPVAVEETKFHVGRPHTTEAAARKAAQKLCDIVYGATAYSHKYKWGKLDVRAKFSAPSSRIEYRIDGDDWHSTPFEVAQFRNPRAALAGVSAWLESQGSN